MSNAFNSAVDKMPFCGKYAIGESVKDYLRANPDQEKMRFMKTAGFLGFMILAHGQQARMSYESFSNHAEIARYSSSTLNTALQAVDVLYGVANAAVTVRQASLLHRVSRTHFKRRSQSMPQKEPAKQLIPSGSIAAELSQPSTEALPTKAAKAEKSRSALGQKGLAASVAFTLAGQAIFMASYFEGENEAAFAKCADSLSEQFQQVENDQRVSIDDGWQQEYIISVC